MSYCRWSSDNMRSDVYAYEDCMGGYTIHVRGVHPVNPEILAEFPDNKSFESHEDFVEALCSWMENNRKVYPDLIYEDIGLEYDDETIRCPDIYDLKEELEWLKQVGYYVPDSAFEMIRDEIEEGLC